MRRDMLLDEVEKTIAQVNDATAALNGGGKPPQPRYDFVQTSEKLAQAIEEAAQQIYNEAQTTLERAKGFAEDLRQRIAEKDQELADIRDRLEAFGKSVLDAHEKFHRAQAQQ